MKQLIIIVFFWLLFQFPANAATYIICNFEYYNQGSNSMCKYAYVYNKDYLESWKLEWSKERLCNFYLAGTNPLNYGWGYAPNLFPKGANVTLKSSSEISYNGDNWWTYGQRLSDEGTSCGGDSAPSEDEQNACSAATSGSDSWVKLMPKTPDAYRLPTIISKLTGEGTLAAALMIEIYSVIWQILAIILLIKVYKLIPGKFS